MSERDNYDASTFINPEFMPYTRHEMVNRETFRNTDQLENGEISKLPEMTSLQPMPGGVELPAQNIETDLMALRASLPFVPMMKWPKSIVSVFLPTAGLAVDLTVPNGAVLGRFSGNADYFISAEGRAIVPGAAGFDPAQASIYKPEWNWFYIGGFSQFSVVSPVANAFVQLVCLSPTLWPTEV